MMIASSLVALALAAAEAPAGATPVREGPAAASPGEGRPLPGCIQFGLGLCTAGSSFHVGGEWTRRRPFFVRVPVGPLVTLDVAVVKGP